MSIICSPTSSRRSSQVPSARCTGAYRAQMDIMCFPLGAIVGSYPEGIWISITGARGGRPCFASSQLCLKYPIDGEILAYPRYRAS